VNSSIFWYDYETTGINPRCDRALQVAGIRTDAELNEIDAPVNLYCQPSDDILPHPAACMITGITPQRLAEHGLGEAEFMTRVHAQLAQAGTCGAGYNTLRFDDEVTRYSLYRNFFDPYAREWQGGNSRWDLIDVVRAAYALRPQGMVWPQVDGKVSMRLELLTAANGIDHGQAHDALSDVRATIALARLIRERQPKLYNWLYALRSKQKVMDQVRLLQPLVHISGRFSAARQYAGVVLPLAWHPRNRNALIVCDLHFDPQPLIEQSVEILRKRLYQRREDLADGEYPVPLKLLHVNRCPVVAPMGVLAEEDWQRLGMDKSLYHARALRLCDSQPHWQDKLAALYSAEEFSPSADPEQQLYDGFLGDRDRRLADRVRSLDPEQLASETWMFDDPRMAELLFRYRARNFPATLTAHEHEQWLGFCRQRLLDPAMGAPNTLEGFAAALAEQLPTATASQAQVLAEWQAHVAALKARLAI
jgi:exodeoxyribonuclease-1